MRDPAARGDTGDRRATLGRFDVGDPSGVTLLAPVRGRPVDQHDDAVADVARSLATLASLLPMPLEVGPSLRLEYPLCSSSGETVLVGYIDLLALSAGTTILLDFKTDAPPTTYASMPRVYAQQIAAYQSMLQTPSRAGLLFTADGIIRWL